MRRHQRAAPLVRGRAELDEIAVRTFERSSSVIGIVLLSQERMEATKSARAVRGPDGITILSPGMWA